MALIQSQSLDAESAAAFRSVRAAKNVFMILTLLAIISVPFATIMTAFVGVLDKPAAASPTPASSPTSAPASSPAAAPAAETAGAAVASAPASAPAQAGESRALVAWRYTLTTLMTVSGIIGPIAAILAVVSLFMAASLSVISRSGGTGGFFSAFFWSLLVLVTLVPWQNIMPGVASGVMANLGEVISEGRSAAGSANTATKVLFYWRYLAYPAMALLLWLLVMLKFARGYNAMNISTTVKPAGPYPIVQNGTSVTDLRRPSEPRPGL